MSDVLIIANDEHLTSRLAPILKNLGHSIQIATDAESTMQIIHKGGLYAVLADINTIPDMEILTEILHVSKPYSIVVFIGTEEQLGVVPEAVSLGLDDYIRKPFSDQFFEMRLRCIFSRFDRSGTSHVAGLVSFMDIVPTMMIITNGRGKILYANTTALQKFGQKKEDVIGFKTGKLIHCENVEVKGKNCGQDCGFCKLYNFEREVFDTGKKIVRKEYSYPQFRNGRKHKKTVRVSMATMDFGNSKAVIINMEDVTFERNAIEELTSTILNLQKSNELAGYLQEINDSLRREKSKLQLLFDNMSSGFMLVHRIDKTLYLQDCNTKLADMLKLDMEKDLGKQLTEIINFDDDKFCINLQKVLDTGISTKFNVNNKQTGTIYNINVYMSEPDYAAALVSDVSNEERQHIENKALTRQLKRQNIMLDDRNEELKKAVETKNKFISIIAHDLRNPFNAIKGLSEMLVKRITAETDSKASEMAKILNQSASGAYDLLESLLVWARSQQNSIKFEPETLNVKTIVEETIKEIKAQAEKKRISIVNAANNNDTVWADKQMIQTIIRNITSNAIKFTHEGGIVMIKSNYNEQSTNVIIEDNGIGMNEETIKKLMIVSKNKSTKGTAGETGSGMGLMISKEFIDKHHGTVKVESEVGKGSKFTINFPNGE